MRPLPLAATMPQFLDSAVARDGGFPNFSFRSDRILE